MASDWKAVGRYGTVGFDLILSIILGYLLGRWVDRHVGGHGYVTVAGVIVGTYAGFRSIYVAAKKMEKEAERDERAQRRAAEQSSKLERFRRDADAEAAASPRDAAGPPAAGEDTTDPKDG